MIGQTVTDPKTGEPTDEMKLAPSRYTPPAEVKKLFGRVQKDYQNAWQLQRRPFDEFDGMSLLERAKLDQETFAAFVGAQYEPRHKRWKWKGRKNTARNKLIGLLAHMLAGMLFPYVYAQNDSDEEDKMTARAMRILVEERLRQTNWERKFFFSVLSALVNPAVYINVEYVEVLQMIRKRAQDGSTTVTQAIDDALSGLQVHVLPIDELLLGDFWSGTGDIQGQPVIFRVRRLHYDRAKELYMGRYKYKGVDLFDYVVAGQTKWLNTALGDQGDTLFDIDDEELDTNYVLELTAYYKSEDLQLTWVGGVGMFDHDDPYNNPFEHRRMSYANGEWVSFPVYPFAMGGFEPIDPAGRFAYFKSGAFKEYWEDKKITELDRLMIDGVKLDVFKPMFLSGVAKVDETVMVPGATVSMPANATATPFSLGPNLVAAYNAIQEANQDMAESTQDKIMQGITQKGITATQTVEAQRNARIFLGVFGFMVATLVKQVGELVADCVIMHDTVGDLNSFSQGAVGMKYKTFMSRGKEKGRDVTNRMIFTDKYMGRNISDERAEEIEWELYDKAGGYESDQRIWEINPYRFARTRYSFYIDADQIVMKSMGTDRLEKERAFEKMMDPRVVPFIDPEQVVNDFVLEEYADGDPDKYKRKGGQDELIAAVLGQATPGGSSGVNQELPTQIPS